MVFVAVGIAIAVPEIGPFISLIGALCFSVLGLMIPIFIEIVTFWEKGFGRYNWRIVKDVIVVVTGILALIFGTKSALEDIIKIYMGPGAESIHNTTQLVDIFNETTTLPAAFFNSTEI